MTLNGNKGIILSKTQRCTCIKMSNQTINPKLLEKIEVIPQSQFCPQVEIIVTMKKTGEKTCLDPKSKNLNNLLKALSKKRSKRTHQQQRKA